MQLVRLEFKPRLWKTVAFVMTLTLLSGLLCLANPGKAGAVFGSVGVPADTLTIKVGYLGGPYYTKKVYTLSDFDELPQVEQAYTFIDNMSAICIDSAKGVKLTDLLEDAGIDVNSVQMFYFYSTDFKVGWYQCLPKTSLLDTPRYYYPNLPSHWDYKAQSPLPEAAYGAVRVEPIIAYKENWRRFADSPDFISYDTSTRFRLLFGQKDTVEHNAPMSAKWVHAIEIMLGGMPPAGVTLDQNLVNLKVGSTVRLTATVGPAEATDKSVTWSSSDTNVATVDDNGLVTVVGQGTATITVSTVVDELTATCVINDPNQDKDSQGGVYAGGNSQNNGPAAADTNPRHLADKYEAERQFLDTQNHWAKDDINSLVEKGIIAGMTDTEFKPEEKITRAQFAKLLVTALNLEVNKGAVLPFQDVPAGAWYHDSVAAAVNAGLIAGYSDDAFAPNENITREQMAVIIARVLKMKLPATAADGNSEEIINKFADKEDISPWARQGIALAVSNGIVSGISADTFAPQITASRAQAAVMILRLDKQLH